MPKRTTYEEKADGFRIDCNTFSWFGALWIPFVYGWCLGIFYFFNRYYGERGGLDLPMLLICICFICGAIVFISYTLMRVCGEVSFELRDGTLEYFCGIYPVGRKRSINWSRLKSVSEHVEYCGRRRTPVNLLYLDEDVVRHKVGRFLSAEQRSFVVRIIARRHDQVTDGLTTTCTGVLDDA